MTPSPPRPMPCDAAPQAVSPLMQPLVAVLEELAQVVASIDAQAYAHARPWAHGGTVGGHVRHSLDHVQALLAGLDHGAINYDQRQRGTAIETDRDAARAALDDVIGRLAAIDDAALDRSLSVETALSSDGPAIRMTCPARRELAFVLSHTVHHNAMIAAMVRAMGLTPPERFGYAPSTLAHLARQASR